MAYDDDRLNRIYYKTDGYCHLCGKKLSRNNYGSNGSKGAWEVDHSIAKANGGTNHLNNLFPACIPCNNEKGTYHKQTIRKRKGYYQDSDESGCYLTTACVVSKGLPDDCEELQVLRWFRDTYVTIQPNGKQLLREYYVLAPRIVEVVNRLKNSGEVYNDMYNTIKLAVEAIQKGNYSKAYALYCSMAEQYKRQYLN